MTVNGSTTYRLGTGAATLSDVKNGSTVVVTGNSTGDNALTALGVRVAPARAVGTVTAKTSDSITIKLRDGSSLVIHVDADTTFRVAGNKSAKLADVTVDMVVGATGRARADGSIDADVVAAGKLRQLCATAPATVDSMDPGSSCRTRSVRPTTGASTAPPPDDRP